VWSGLLLKYTCCSVGQLLKSNTCKQTLLIMYQFITQISCCEKGLSVICFGLSSCSENCVKAWFIIGNICWDWLKDYIIKTLRVNAYPVVYTEGHSNNGMTSAFKYIYQTYWRHISHLFHIDEHEMNNIKLAKCPTRYVFSLPYPKVFLLEMRL